MRIHTTFGIQENATDADMERELGDLQRYLDPADPGFVRIRSTVGGPELELTTVQLRLHRDGRVLLGTLPPPVRDFVRAFAAGRPDWDAGIEWTDVTPVPWRRRLVPYLVAIAIAVAVVVGMFWFFLSRMAGPSS